MNWLKLYPEDIAARVKSSAAPARAPGLGASLAIGAVGFALLGVAGFLPWVTGLAKHFGEIGMFVACALVFLALSGPLLHRLIIGPGSLGRFYALFAVAFSAYAVVYCLLWFTPEKRDYAGLFAGCAVFSVVVASAFGAWRQLIPALMVLTALHVGGYYLGDIFYSRRHDLAGRLVWGLLYGVGFGAGIGLVFYLCQSTARKMLAALGSMT